MTCQILFFHRTHEEEQGIDYASCFFIFHLTISIAQILTCHMTVPHIYVVVLTNVWSI